VWTPIDCFGREKELGRRVIVIGGGGTGSETAFYLADSEHEVTIITRQGRVLHDDMSHGGQFLFDLFVKHPRIRVVTDTRISAIKDGRVAVLTGLDGIVYELTAGSIVVSAGVTPLTDECAAFAGLTPELYVIGDAIIHDDMLYWGPMFTKNLEGALGGDVRHATATAYAAAMSL
jgi:pyruvate/2-oxoglutarate dehydrogenase complex dihydrolipoamide dehydrogenase (E3) component